MKAIPGRTYARAVDGVIVELWDETTLPEWNDAAINAIDVTTVPGGVVPGMLQLNDGTIAQDPGVRPSEYHRLDINTGNWVEDADVDAKKEVEAVGVFDGKKELRTLFEVLFTIVNDIRALNAQQPVTRDVLRRQILDIYKSL